MSTALDAELAAPGEYIMCVWGYGALEVDTDLWTTDATTVQQAIQAALAADTNFLPNIVQVQQGSSGAIYAACVMKTTNADNGVGTGQWLKTTQTAASTFVTSTDIAGAFTLFGSQMPDGYIYVKCTLSTNDGVGVIAILHDLTVQRKPANLTILSA